MYSSSNSSLSSLSQPSVGSRYSTFFSSGLRAISRRQSGSSHLSIPLHHRPPPSPYLNRRHVPPTASIDASVIQSPSPKDALLKLSGVKHLKVIIRTFQPSPVKLVSDLHVTLPDEKRAVRTLKRSARNYDCSFLCFDGDPIMSERSLLTEKSTPLIPSPKPFARQRCMSAPSPPMGEKWQSAPSPPLSSPPDDRSFMILSPVRSEAPTPLPSRPSTPPPSLPSPLPVSVSRNPARRSRQGPAVPLWTQRRCTREWNLDQAGLGYTRARHSKRSSNP